MTRRTNPGTTWTNSNSGAPCTVHVIYHDGAVTLVVRNSAGQQTGTLTTDDEGQMSQFAADVVRETGKAYTR
jgi:hypothetical protein